MTTRVIVGRGEGSDVLVMFPSGDVRTAKSVKGAERMVMAWAKRDLSPSEVRITSIVWRDGLTPTTVEA